MSELNQTFKDLEITVVYDASNENTKEAASGFNDERIKYICHEVGKGEAEAGNTGVRNSIGQYIAFLDDDEWLLEKLALQVDLIENSLPKIGGVYSGFITMDRVSGKVLGQKTLQKGDIYNDMRTINVI